MNFRYRPISLALMLLVSVLFVAVLIVSVRGLFVTDNIKSGRTVSSGGTYTKRDWIVTNGFGFVFISKVEFSFHIGFSPQPHVFVASSASALLRSSCANPSQTDFRLPGFTIRSRLGRKGWHFGGSGTQAGSSNQTISSSERTWTLAPKRRFTNHRSPLMIWPEYWTSYLSRIITETIAMRLL